jgi:hypothetical protein
MGPQAVVACGDAEPGEEVVDKRPVKSSWDQGGEPGEDKASSGKEYDGSDVDPVYLLMPCLVSRGRRRL